MKRMTYKKAGVNIEKADAFVRKLRTLFSAPAGTELSAFGSIFPLHLSGSRRPQLVASTDGVGTKLLLAQQFGIHTTVGIDLVAMNVNDIVCLGARPLFFLDYIACGKVQPKMLLDIARGIKRGLSESGCTLLGGETAEMPGMYKENEYDLAGFCVGIVDAHKVIDGRTIASGDVVIGLASSGLHSNGFSFVRRLLSKKELKERVKELLTPTRIYVQPILSLLSASRSTRTAVTGVAHVTGGAFFNKVTKILPSQYGIYLRTGSWPVPDVFNYIQSVGAVSEQEMYTVFNMGIGMVLIVKKHFAERVVRRMNKKVPAYIIGEVTDRQQGMVLV